MSRNVLITGKFRNGVERHFGLHNPNGCEYKSSLFIEDDLLHLKRMYENFDRPSFARCEELGKFKEITVNINCSCCDSFYKTIDYTYKIEGCLRDKLPEIIKEANAHFNKYE